MKYVLLLLSGLFFSKLQAQEYRLSYDSSTIPELYNTTSVILEKKEGNTYVPVKRGYKLTTNEAQLKGHQVSYKPSDLAAHAGIIHFKAVINGQEVPLSLELPVLKEIRFNLYADSIKPILNYYVNVEGVYSSGKVYPLTGDQVAITSDQGTMNGNEWVVAKERHYEKVVFTATSRFNSAITASTTVYIKKYRDPRDAEGYQDRTEDEIMRDRNR